jgi:hypothetical protein
LQQSAVQLGVSGAFYTDGRVPHHFSGKFSVVEPQEWDQVMVALFVTSNSRVTMKGEASQITLNDGILL